MGDDVTDSNTQLANRREPHEPVRQLDGEAADAMVPLVVGWAAFKDVTVTFEAGVLPPSETPTLHGRYSDVKEQSRHDSMIGLRGVVTIPNKR